MVRSVFEYASTAYHSMLTKEDTEELERLQKMSLKTIYGFHKPYGEILEDHGILTLKERRERALEKFACKLSENKRYESWLPKQEFIHYNLKKELVFKEKHAKTSRLYNSPLYTIRRKLNEPPV